MSDDTLPPVGATVEDADGTSYVRLGSWNAQRDEIEYCWAREVESLGTKGLVEVLEPSGLAAVLTASWRMQQERDQFKAELQTLRERVGDLEVDVAIGEGRGAIIDELTARVVELEAVRDQLATDLQGALESARNSGAAQDHMRLYGAETREERDRLKARLDAIDAACIEVCRDNHESTVGDDVDTEMGRYVCIGESGDPVIDEDEPAEVVRRLSQVWERMQERSEKAEAERDRTLKANKDLQARVGELEKGRATALYAAVSAVYFDDTSDFRSYLWDVVRTLGGSEMAERLDGEDASSVYDAALRAQGGA